MHTYYTNLAPEPRRSCHCKAMDRGEKANGVQWWSVLSVLSSLSLICFRLAPDRNGCQRVGQSPRSCGACPLPPSVNTDLTQSLLCMPSRGVDGSDQSGRMRRLGARGQTGPIGPNATIGRRQKDRGFPLSFPYPDKKHHQRVASPPPPPITTRTRTRTTVKLSNMNANMSTSTDNNNNMSSSLGPCSRSATRPTTLSQDGEDGLLPNPQERSYSAADL